VVHAGLPAVPSVPFAPLAGLTHAGVASTGGAGGASDARHVDAGLQVFAGLPLLAPVFNWQTLHTWGWRMPSAHAGLLPICVTDNVV